MPVVHSEATIAAPRAIVWEILTDLPRYPEWNPFTVKARSTLEVGEPIDLRVRMMGGLFGRWPGGWFQSQTEYIRAHEPGVKVCWGAEMFGGRVEAERCQWLEELDPERTRYINEDEIGGPWSGLVMRYFGSSMQVGFDRVALALKERAEATQREA